MKSLVTLHLAVLHDAGLLCGVNTTMDEKTLAHRSRAEGDGFLTITLPSLSKGLERALSDGKWTRQHCSSFKSGSGRLPAFMQGFFSRIFSASGELLDAPDANCIWAIRQVSNLVGKVERPCTLERENNAFLSYIQTDRELGDHFRRGISPELDDTYSRMCLRLFGNVFNELDRKIANFELVPRFGPGSTADRLDMPERWNFHYWPDRLQGVFPRWRYGTYNGAWKEPTVSLGSELPARVVSVPKTQKTPRIIAMEPATVQFAQQALKTSFYDLIEDSWLRGILGFTDQTRNQEMALTASIDGSLATLDLSEASDRVHLSMVEKTFSRWPHLMDYMLAARSLTADVKGDEITLHKYASMGSALTFPFEAIVFTIIAAMGMERSGHSTSPKQLLGRLSVYGDDIIVPNDAALDVVDYLHAFGLKVNMHKSFWTGRFRESCGKEYYAGTDVSVVRLRADVPTSRREADLIRRFTEFRNRAYRAGLWTSVKVSDMYLDKLVKLRPRHVDEELEITSSVLAKTTVLPVSWSGVLWDDKLQIWTERHSTVRSTSPSYVVDDEGGVLRWFLMSLDKADSKRILDRYENQERSRAHRMKTARIERLPKRTMVLTDLRGPLN